MNTDIIAQVVVVGLSVLSISLGIKFLVDMERHIVKLPRWHIKAIRSHYHKACTKHPDFIGRIAFLDYSVKGMYDDNVDLARFKAELPSATAMELVNEEMAEFLQAFSKGDLVSSRDELYDAVAVLLRMVDKIDEELLRNRIA